MYFRKLLSAATLFLSALTVNAAPIHFTATGVLTEHGTGAFNGANINFDVSGTLDIDAAPLFQIIGMDYAYYELEGGSSGSISNLGNISFDSQGLELQNDLSVFGGDATALGVAEGTTVDLFSIALRKGSGDDFYTLYVDLFYNSNFLDGDALSDLSGNTFESAALGGRAFLFKESNSNSILDSIEGSVTTNSVAAVPLPGALWLFGMAIFGLAGTRRRFQLSGR